MGKVITADLYNKGSEALNGTHIGYAGTYFIVETVTEAIEACYDAILEERGFTASEVNTGAKWIDGKDIYKKTIQFTTRSSAGGANIAHGITGISDVVDYFLYIKMTGAGVVKENYISSGYNVSCNIKFDGNFYYSVTATDGAYYSKPAHITIYYTKTT